MYRLVCIDIDGTPSDHHSVRDYIQREGQNVKSVPELVKAFNWDPLRIMTYGHKDPTESCYHQFQELYGGFRTLLTTDIKTTYMELYPEQATKANGLRWLSSYYQISREKIVAFGDNLNDLDMLEWAGLGVAMGSAVPEAKAVVDLVTGDNNEDGIAQILEGIL